MGKALFDGDTGVYRGWGRYDIPMPEDIKNPVIVDMENPPKFGSVLRDGEVKAPTAAELKVHRRKELEVQYENTHWVRAIVKASESGKLTKKAVIDERMRQGV